MDEIKALGTPAKKKADAPAGTNAAAVLWACRARRTARLDEPIHASNRDALGKAILLCLHPGVVMNCYASIRVLLSGV